MSFCSCFGLVFEIESYYVAQAGLELEVNLLSVKITGVNGTYFVFCPFGYILGSRFTR